MALHFERAEFDARLSDVAPGTETNDADSIFLTYVMERMPVGVVGIDSFCGFRDGLPGFIISVGAAYSVFLKFAKLWEAEHRSRNQAQNQSQD